MGDVVLDLIPLALGVVLSPLAIVALVAVLVSDRGRVNGVAFLLGWLGGLSVLIAFFGAVFSTVTVAAPAASRPPWVALVRVVLGIVLITFGALIYRRGRQHLEQMKAARKFGEVVTAAPQLPGWLKSVEHFRAGRTFLLGVGLFVLNPVDASCTILAAMSIWTAAIPVSTAQLISVVFVAVGSLPIAVPVGYVVVRGESAGPVLHRLRDWIAGNSHVLNAGLLLMVGAMQLQNGLSALANSAA